VLRLSGVERAYGRLGLDPARRDPITLAHRCPSCRCADPQAAITVEYEVGVFASYCERCQVAGPRGFEAMMGDAVAAWQARR